MSADDRAELTAEDERSRGRNFLNMRGNLVPFLRLRELLEVPGAPGQHQKTIIISTGETRVGLVADQIIGNHQTVIKSMSALHRDIGSFSGATILGDGNVALILDIGHLVDLAHVPCREEHATVGVVRLELRDELLQLIDFYHVIDVMVKRQRSLLVLHVLLPVPPLHTIHPS